MGWVSVAIILVLAAPSALAQQWRPPPPNLAWVLSSRGPSPTGEMVTQTQTQQVLVVEDEFLVIGPAEAPPIRVVSRMDRGLMLREVTVTEGETTQTVRYIYDRAVFHQLWPLADGKTVVLDVAEQITPAMTLRYAVTFTVEGEEEVMVEGNRFTCRRILMDRTQEGVVVAKSIARYCPRVSTVLQHEVTVMQGSQGAPMVSVQQVVRIGLSRPAATP